MSICHTRAPSIERAIAVALVTTLAACAPAAEKDDPNPPPLVGTWLAVSPSALAGDTLVLLADGTAMGASRVIDAEAKAISRWQIGARVMPGGFCVRAEESLWCQGFRLSGDTLGLANQSRTVFLRVTGPGGAARTAARLRTEDFRHVRVGAPAPGESVPRVPSGMRLQ